MHLLVKRKVVKNEAKRLPNMEPATILKGIQKPVRAKPPLYHPLRRHVCNVATIARSLARLASQPIHKAARFSPSPPLAFSPLGLPVTAHPTPSQSGGASA